MPSPTVLRAVCCGAFAVVWFPHDEFACACSIRMKNVVHNLRSPEEEDKKSKVEEEKEEKDDDEEEEQEEEEQELKEGLAHQECRQ
jgi:hypothetical protein